MHREESIITVGNAKSSFHFHTHAVLAAMVLTQDGDKVQSCLEDMRLSHIKQLCDISTEVSVDVIELVVLIDHVWFHLCY